MRINIHTMNIKEDRQSTIRNLIARKKIASQEDLQAMLKASGYEVTQATLSRDLKELKITKVHDSDSGYYYKEAEDQQIRAVNHTAIVSADYIQSLEFSGQMGVLKTPPGFASVVASLIDHKSPSSVMGTVAGDDTVIIIIREGYSRAQVIDELAFISEIKKKINK